MSTGLGQLFDASHKNIMIHINISASQYSQTVGFHLHTPDDLIIYNFISLFLSVPS
jgi:hypothetical protein